MTVAASQARGHPAGRRALHTSWFFLLSLPGSNAPRAGSLRTSRCTLLCNRCRPPRRGTAGFFPEAVTRLPPAPKREARRKGSRTVSRPAVLAVTRMSVKELARQIDPAPAPPLPNEDGANRRERAPADSEPGAPASLSDRGSSSAHRRVRRRAGSTICPTRHPTICHGGQGPPGHALSPGQDRCAAASPRFHLRRMH